MRVVGDERVDVRVREVPVQMLHGLRGVRDWVSVGREERDSRDGGEKWRRIQADLEKDVVTHLVAKQTNGQAEPTGLKYTREDVEIFVLSRKWVDECVRRGVNFQTSTTLKEWTRPWSFGKAPIVVLPTKEELTKQLEEEYDEDKRRGQHYLFSTKVYLVGFTNSSCNSSSSGGGRYGRPE